MRRAGLVSLAALALVASGCASSPTRQSSADVVASKPPSTAELVNRAGLADCPAPGRGGADLPAVTLPCLGDGPAVPLARLTGAPTVLNIWASWCVPCQREVPFFQALHAAAGDRLRVLGVDTEDSSRSALDFAAHAGMRYPCAHPVPRHRVGQLRGVGPPMTVFVDAAGRVRHVARGEYERLADLRRDTVTYLGVRT